MTATEPTYGTAVTAAIEEQRTRIFRYLPRLSLAEWADQYRRWQDESPYRVDETPHLRPVLDAYSDPAVEEIVVQKPTQSGFTEGLILNAIGYHVDQDPRGILVVIPSVDEAEKWSKKKLQPMIDATPRLQGRLDAGSRKTSDTILEKTYRGGSLGIVGSNSGKGFRMITVGTAFGDDVNGWDATAGKGPGSEGDQITLIRRRTDRIPNRKLVWISTPTRPHGRISQLRRQMERSGEFHVPCPHCGAMQVLRWGGPGAEYGLKWETERVDPTYRATPGEVVRGGKVHRPDTVYYLCEVNGCRIDEHDKPAMEAAGEYLAADGLAVHQPGVSRLGFWLHGALTITLPGSEWPKLVREFLDVVDKPMKLMAFVNTILAEEWEERGEAPEWERLYERREAYPIGRCPEGVEFLTVGADVQHNRVEVFVWGWGREKESWFIEHLVVSHPISDAKAKQELTGILHRTWPQEGGGELALARFAIDTGYEQEAVIDWARRVGDARVMLVKGDHWKNWRVIVGSPARTDVTYRGRRTGLQLWPVGGALIKQETYGFLRLASPLDGEPFPDGWIHLPQIDDELCKQLVAEDLYETVDPKGYGRREWVKHRPRNEMLDGRVYARAAAEQLGLSRMTDQPPPKPPKPAKADAQGKDKWLDSRRGGRPQADNFKKDTRQERRRWLDR